MPSAPPWYSCPGPALPGEQPPAPARISLWVVLPRPRGTPGRFALLAEPFRGTPAAQQVRTNPSDIHMAVPVDARQILRVTDSGAGPLLTGIVVAPSRAEIRSAGSAGRVVGGAVVALRERHLPLGSACLEFHEGCSPVPPTLYIGLPRGKETCDVVAGQDRSSGGWPRSRDHRRAPVSHAPLTVSGIGTVPVQRLTGPRPATVWANTTSPCGGRRGNRYAVRFTLDGAARR